MSERFIFRQVQADDLKIFLNDGEIRARNHENMQKCYQVSYQEIVNRRNDSGYLGINRLIINDYVQFYFSPFTSFSFTIKKGNVDVLSPDGVRLGKSSDERRIFLVCKIKSISDSNLNYCFSNYSLNKLVPNPEICEDINLLERHIKWHFFDEDPKQGHIPEIGYDGVCRYFNSKEPSWQWRSEARMAEFLVKRALPLSLVACIIVKTLAIKQELQKVMDASRWNIPIYVKRDCYF